MKIKRVFAILLMSMVLAGPLYAGSVYFWTDENGVRHYSNTGLPDEVVDADVRPEESAPSQPAETSDEPDVDAKEGEPPTGPQEGETAEAAPDAGGAKPFDDRLAAQAEKERQRLEAEMKRIKGLSIGKSFTQGMKDAQIRPLQEQLSLLSADPKRYFRMKREGAFKSSSDSDSGGNSPSTSDPLSGNLSSEPGTSSSGGSSGNDATSPKEAKEEKTSDDKAQSDGKKSDKSRSSGSGSTLFPEN